VASHTDITLKMEKYIRMTGLRLTFMGLTGLDLKHKTMSYMGYGPEIGRI